ncbi:MAG: c-type cytochrome, partial [Pirellulales bacterium]
SLDMRLLAIRYAAESYEKPLINNLESLLSSPQLKASEFHHLISALSFLRTGSASGAKRDPARDQLLIDFFKDNTKPVALRQLALRQLPSSSKAIDSKSLLDLIKDSSLKELHRDALAMLIARHEESTIKILDDLLLSNETQASFRADILASLVSIPSWCDAWSDAKQAQLLSVSPDKNFAIEVQRVARAIRNLPAQDAQRPKRDSIDQWIKLINGGDALRGWRVWARSQCVQCHMMDGRGAELGPDLTALQAASDRKRTLQSMLEPSREVAPLFATWQILTTDGRVLVGAKLNGGGVGTNLRFLASDGKVFEVALSEIETQRLSFKSIMPDDITDKLTIDEIQDLLEYLSPSSSH